MKSGQRGAIDMMLVGAIAIVLLVGGFVLYRITSTDDTQTSTFTDGLGEEQEIKNFQDCMDWVMPWEIDGDEVVCTAPDDVEFRAQCEDVAEVDCANNSSEAEESSNEDGELTSEFLGTQVFDDSGDLSITIDAITDEVSDDGVLTEDTWIAFTATIGASSGLTDPVSVAYTDFSLVNADGSEIGPSDGLGTTIVGPGEIAWDSFQLAAGETEQVVVFFYVKDRGDSSSGTLYWDSENGTDPVELTFVTR